MSNQGYKTPQEAFWAGSFGDEYIDRNQGEALIASNIHLFADAFRRAQKPSSCIEFGANIGLNLCALKALYPNQRQYAVEINPKAAATLRERAPWVEVFETSILEFDPAVVSRGG